MFIHSAGSNHSHSIIYGNHNQLSDNIFPKLHFFST
ncbi:hypothetical protein ECFRIK1985_3828, partial [Escherichia coli FRIK1985]